MNPKLSLPQGQAGHSCWPIRPATRPQCCWKEVRAAHLKLFTHGTDFLQVEYVCLDAGQVPGDVPATLSVPSFQVALRDPPSPNLRRCPSPWCLHPPQCFPSTEYSNFLSLCLALKLISLAKPQIYFCLGGGLCKESRQLLAWCELCCCRWVSAGSCHGRL